MIDWLWVSFVLLGATFGYFLGREHGCSKGSWDGQERGYNECYESYADAIKTSVDVRDQGQQQGYLTDFQEKYPTFDSWYGAYVAGILAICPELENKKDDDLFNRNALLAFYNNRKSPRALGATLAAKAKYTDGED